MNQERTLGLQWKLAALYLAASLLSIGTMALGIVAAGSFGLAPTSALGVGIGAGLVVGLITGSWGFLLARQMKHRLWDAGDLALRISQGELSARLEVGRLDEIGVLEEQLNQMADYLEQAVGQLSRLAEQNRLLAEEAGRGAALEERARIARDLHDTVNQQLFVLSLRAAAARKQMARLDGSERADAGELARLCGSDGPGTGETAGLDSSRASLVGELTALEEIARQAHSQTRELILELRPTTLEQQGLGPALHEYLQATAAKEGWQVNGRIDLGVRLRGSAGEALFRIAQEALNNIAKHAKAQTVRVDLGWVDSARGVRGGADAGQAEGGQANGRPAAGLLQLTVADDGVGFDPVKNLRPTSVGLIGMQERVSALNGQFRIRTAPGHGTEITVTLQKEGIE